MKKSVGNDGLIRTNYDKLQKKTDTRKIEMGNSGGHLLQQSKIKINDINGVRNLTSFFRAIKTSTPTNHSEATSLSPFGNCSMYIETSCNIHAAKFFCSFERKDIIHSTKKNSFITDSQF